MKKKSMLKKLTALTLLVSSVCMFTACGGSPKPKVTITLDGVEIPFETELQTCIDGGLVTTDNKGNEADCELSFGAMEVMYESVHLGTSSTPHRSEVAVMLYNPTSERKTAYGSKIMTLSYYVDQDNSDQAPVLFNGIDFWGMTVDEAIAALQEQGFEVDPEDLGEYHFLVFSGDDSVVVTIEFALGSEFENAKSQAPKKKVLEFDENTYYVSEVKASITGKLNIDYGS